MASKNDLFKYPINYLYAFISQNAYKNIVKYFGNKAANTIYSKAQNQMKQLNNYAIDNNTTLQVVGDKLRQVIVSQYGLQPEQIISKLMAGETVAGKNWKKGVYGVGATNRDDFNGTPVQVNTDTGELYVLQGGVESYQQPNKKTPIYSNKDNKTEITGYCYELSDGSTYTVKKVGNDWWADTYTKKDGSAYFADGSTYSSDKTSSVWVDTLTSENFMSKFLEWLIKIFDKLTGKNTELMTAKNTFPSQDEFMTESDKGTINTATIGILGAALIGGYLLFGNSKKKNKKSN